MGWETRTLESNIRPPEQQPNPESNIRPLQMGCGRLTGSDASLCPSLQSGETMLIGAVRGGHVEIVRALLNKYADIDVRGQVSPDLRPAGSESTGMETGSLVGSHISTAHSIDVTLSLTFSSWVHTFFFLKSKSNVKIRTPVSPCGVAPPLDC